MNYIDWIVDEQARGNIQNVKWRADEKGTVHFSFSVDPDKMNKRVECVGPTYRNWLDCKDDDQS